jgi:ABC-type maltose transport system permease subunit
MKIVGAIILVIVAGFLAFASVIFGALMLTSANGPTRENWIAHYVLVYVVPVVIVVVCIFILVRMFR